MPTSTLKYGAAATQAATADRDWTNVSNVLLRDGNLATITALLALEVSEVITITEINPPMPEGAIPTSVTITVRASDSGFVSEGTVINIRLYDGTTAFGAFQGVSTTATALTDYTITGSFGGTLTPGLVRRLRVAVYLIAAEVSTNFAIDSVAASVTYKRIPKRMTRTRARFR